MERLWSHKTLKSSWLVNQFYKNGAYTLIIIFFFFCSFTFIIWILNTATPASTFLVNISMSKLTASCSFSFLFYFCFLLYYSAELPPYYLLLVPGIFMGFSLNKWLDFHWKIYFLMYSDNAAVEKLCLMPLVCCRVNIPLILFWMYWWDISFSSVMGCFTQRVCWWLYQLAWIHQLRLKYKYVYWQYCISVNQITPHWEATVFCEVKVL